MPEEQKKQDEQKQAAPAEPPKRSPIKTILVVLGLLVAEAAVVIFAFSTWATPESVRGQGISETPEDALNRRTEVLIVNDRFPNHHTGRVWLWEIEVQVTVKQKHLDFVQRVLTDRNAEIKTGVSQIIRTAHHNHLKEPNLDTLTRQLSEYLKGILGEDAEGEPRVQAVLIPKCVGFPADF